LSRAQQDKAYTESMLAQQVAAWKSSLSSTNPVTLEQELTQLQGQLLQLQARYTDDYPDVIKTKADIAEVQKKLKEAMQPRRPPRVRPRARYGECHRAAGNRPTPAADSPVPGGDRAGCPLDQKKLQSRLRSTRAAPP
jgi:hypothetical protein